MHASEDSCSKTRCADCSNHRLSQIRPMHVFRWDCARNVHRRFGVKRELSRRRAHLAGNAVIRAGLDPANQISRSLGSRDSYRVLAEAAPPGAAAKTGHHRLRQARRHNPKRMHRYGTPSLGTSREEFQSSSSGFPERISVTPIRRNPPCNSFSTCRKYGIGLEVVFGTGL
jgi:hypothetical protein